MKINTKFDVGQKVYYIAYARIKSAQISRIDINVLNPKNNSSNIIIQYTLPERTLKESIVYASKADLVANLLSED